MKEKFILLLVLLLISPSVLAADEPNVTISSTSLLDSPVNLPYPVKLFLGIKDAESVSITKLIVLIGVFIMILLVLHSVIGLIPLLDGEGVKGFFSALVISLVLGITGSTYFLTDLLLSISSIFGLIESIGWLTFTIALIVILALTWFLKKFMKKITQSYREQRAREEGHNVGRMDKRAEDFAEQERKLAKGEEI